MQCGFAAAGMGYRPENSDRETTSLETPSVPTSEGLNCPVHLPEVGPQTNDPSSRRLDCLVSPPPPPPATTTATTTVCSQESSQAESVNPRAVKPVDSLHELPATLESKELLPLQRKLPEDVASANARTSLAEEAGKTPCRSPRIPPRTISGKTFVWGNLRKPDDAQCDAFDAEPPDGLGGQGASSETCSQAEELDIPLLMEQVEEPHVGLFKAHTKPKHGQNEPNSSEHLCPMALSPLPAPAELGPDGFFSEGRAGIEWERRISPAKKRRPEEVGPRGGEVFMDVVAREPFVATDSLFSTSGATQPGADAECSRMEVETSSHPSSLPLSSPPVSGLTQRGGAASESTDGSAMMGLMGAPSGSHLSDQMEEPCISLTSALKELHQLLVVNSKQDVDVSQPEDLPPSISVPQEQATGHEVHQGKREPTYLDIPASGYTGTESSVKRQMFEAAGEGTHVTEMHKLTVSHEQAMLTVQGTSAVDSSGFLTPPAFSGQVQGAEHVEETLSQRPSSSHVLLSSEASEQSFSLGQSQGSQSSFSESMETSSAPGTRFQRLMNGLLDSSPLLPLDGSPLSVTHADEINHLVGDGFTPQEATEALERAGGNLELALLILLAKSIVVPT